MRNGVPFARGQPGALQSPPLPETSRLHRPPARRVEEAKHTQAPDGLPPSSPPEFTTLGRDEFAGPGEVGGKAGVAATL